ncbi:hypothetical protein FM21_15400 [Streptomyces mutabilis]|uniref:Uncharacterized protein n=1 Tax=Streptomyces mutabilis TaxID=67332 RepID=A0A086N8A1_9ACTN|nr:hypothetical protein FM21_15400 [Streptomyces mutabilis]
MQSLAESSSSQARYSGTSMPQRPGQPSADAWPSSEMMKSTMRSDIDTSFLQYVRVPVMTGAGADIHGPGLDLSRPVLRTASGARTAAGLVGLPGRCDTEA